MEVKIFTDGGARGNPGPAAAGVVLEGFAGKERLFCGKYLGVTTNNIAEYSAVILAYETLLEKISDTKETVLTFYTDSSLVANQLSGKFRVKNQNLALFVNEIKDYQDKFKKVTYVFVPREENKLADREVNKILDSLTTFD